VAMAEDGAVRRRFLQERKRAVKTEVATAREEYEKILTYLRQLMRQVKFSDVNWNGVSE